MNEPHHPPAAKPTLWQRTKHFFSYALGYIPRGIILTSVAFAASSALEAYTGFGLGINSLDGPHLIARFAAHLALGSMVSGVIGATTTPCPVCENNNNAASFATAPFKLNENERLLGQQISKEVTGQLTNLAQNTVADSVIPGSSTTLNTALPILKTFTQSQTR
jgi:hypothetical protein